MTALSGDELARERYGRVVRSDGDAGGTVAGPPPRPTGPDDQATVARRRAELLADDAAWLAANRRRRIAELHESELR